MKYVYTVQWNYHFEEVVEETHPICEQEVLDKLADKLESEGAMGCFLTQEEIKTDNVHECEYVVCGNHCLNLYTHGMLVISCKEVEDEEEDTRVRCNNCGTIWNTEEDVPLLIRYDEDIYTKIGEYEPEWYDLTQLHRVSIYKGCPLCMSDSYLTDMKDIPVEYK